MASGNVAFDGAILVVTRGNVRCAIAQSQKFSATRLSGVLTRRSGLDIMYSMSPALRPVSLVTIGMHLPSRRSWSVSAVSCLSTGRMLGFDGEAASNFWAHDALHALRTLGVCLDPGPAASGKRTSV